MLPNGEREIREVDIQVTGSCVTPSPTPDIDPPPAPRLLSPVNEWSGDCAVSQVDFSWTSVTDPSGVTGYKVEVQYDTGGTWAPYHTLGATTTSAALSPIAPDTSLCPGTAQRTYRWRVRAIDGEGNQGDWSGWWSFSLAVIIY